MSVSLASVRTIACCSLAGILWLAGPASGETIKGQTVLASYQASGLCAESNRTTGELHLARCVGNAAQEFHIETFHDIAQQVWWNKIMNGKNCLQAGYFRVEKISVERCSISTWSRSAFWLINPSGALYSQEKYCPHRKNSGVSIGTAVITEKCRESDPAEFYPAILTRSAKVGPQTLAAYDPARPIKAIVVESGFSGANLVASEGAFLKLDKSGNVSATNGGFIIAGGAGAIIEDALGKVPGSGVLKPTAYTQSQTDYAPKSLAFFSQEEDRGKLFYLPR
jgi:hypothetical protein